MRDFLVALGLVFVIEGLIYAAFPESMKRMLETVRHLDTGTMRVAGVAALVLGIGIVWLVRS